MIRSLRSVLRFAAVVPLATILLTSCDQKEPPKTVEKKEKKKAAESPDKILAEGRTQLISGQFEEAAETLGKASDDPKGRPLLLNWIQFHQGLALMMSGKEAEARPVFAKIEERGLYPKGSNDPELAEFMVKLSRQLSGKDPVAPDVSGDYNKYNYQGIALLALAMKDFDLDKFEDAEAFFRQFTDVSPERQVEWADGPADLQKLKDMANNFVNDYQAFAPARKALDEAAEKPIDDQRVAVELAQKARAQMKLTSKLSKSLDDTLGTMAPKVAAVMEERAKTSAAEMASDEKTMAEAKEKRTDLMTKFMFGEAHSVIADANFKTEKAKDEQELLAKKTQWLSNFKDQLIEDLNKHGYTKAITTKKGDLLPGSLTKADQQQIFVGTAASPVAVPWGDVSLDSIYEMGLSFISGDMAPNILAFHQWHLGVFAFYAGRQKDALSQLRQAAIARPVFKDELPLFENASGPY
jgi:tetratricopeptide (TPR) repeat protein